MGNSIKRGVLTSFIARSLREFDDATPMRAAYLSLLLGATGYAQMANAQNIGMASGDADATTLDAVSVVGAGSTRTTASVAKSEIEAQAPGVAPQMLLSTLPGVNVQTTDPFGLYEFGDSMRIRGFSSNQVGVTLDGIPIETADVREGGPISRYVSTENLADVTLSPGSGDVTQPSYHALGGAIRYSTLAPVGGDDWSGRATMTMGSYDLVRTFVRVDTPQWWDNGPAAYFSASRIRSGIWDLDPATQESDHFEAKIRQDWDAGTLTLGWIWNNREDHDIQAYTVNGGLDWDITEFITGDPAFDSNNYTVWKNGRRDSLLSLAGDFMLTSALGLKFVAYNEEKNGWGIGATGPGGIRTQYNNAIAGTPGRTDIVILDPTAVFDADGNLVSIGNMARRLEDMGGTRRGLTTSFSWETEINKLEVGAWYETYEFFQTRPLYNVDPSSGEILQGELPIVIYYDRHFDSTVTQLFVMDTLKLMDEKLTLQAGVKGLRVEREFTGIANLDDFNRNATRTTEKTDSDWFQPQAGASYQVGDGTQLFANYAENFSSVPRLAMVAGGGTWETLQPETSKNIDLGIRSEHQTWSGYVALYRIAYKDRIITLSDPDPQVVDSTVYQNVGDIETYGAEASALWQPTVNWRLGGNLSLNRSEFQDNYINTAGELVEVEGNDVPDQPRVSLGLSGGYQGEHFFANLDGKYTGKRYGDTRNNERTDTTFIANGSVGYQGGDAGFLADGRVQLSVYNLFDADDAIGAVFPNEAGGSYNLVAPRSVYLSLSYVF
jgi:iron complex outermembrane receptor protein